MIRLLALIGSATLAIPAYGTPHQDPSWILDQPFQTVVQGDLFTTSFMSLGPRHPLSRLSISGQKGKAPLFAISGVDKTRFLSVSNDGRTSLSVAQMGDPAARLDIGGSLSLNARGDGVDRYQLLLGDMNAKKSHSIRSRLSEKNAQPVLDFLVWSGGPKAGSLPKNLVASIGSSGGILQIAPVGKSNSVVTVSNTKVMGEGIVHRFREVSPMNRDSLENVQPLDDKSSRTAAEELFKIRYARMGDSSLRPLYGLTPKAIQRPEGFVSLDGRVTVIELSFKEIASQLVEIEARVDRVAGKKAK